MVDGLRVVVVVVVGAVEERKFIRNYQLDMNF
jgi:hypothetical protein